MLGNPGLCAYIVLPLAAWAPAPLSPPAPGYWRRCRSSAPHHLEKGGLLFLSGGGRHTQETLNILQYSCFLFFFFFLSVKPIFKN